MNFGFSVNLLKFSFSYLQARKLFVIYNGACSEEFNVMSGIPRGSNLGLSLFLVFINDLVHVVKSSKFLLFTDCRNYKEILSIHDSHQLLHNLLMWCQTNNLVLNIDKCAVISYTRKHIHIVYRLVLIIINWIVILYKFF